MSRSKELKVKKKTGKLTIQAPGEATYLTEIRELVADLCHQAGFPDSEVAKIEMAVDEACTNVVEHAYAADKQWFCQQAEPEIKIDVRTRKGKLVIEIKDHGQKFDFASYRPTPMPTGIAQSNPGGYGIQILQRFMDEVQYSWDSRTGNTLRLVKHLKKA